MKAKIERGRGFRGVLNYALGKGCGYVVGGNMTGTTPRDLSAEFAISRRLRPDVSRPVWHTSLSLPPGERLSDSEWSTVVDDFMSRMGFSDHQYVAVRHSDTGKDHVHIVASRIGLDGSLYHGKYEALNAIQLTQELELKYGLTVTKGLLDGPAPVATPSKNEMEMSIRTGDAPPRVVLQQLVDAALSQPCSIFDFIERLETAGVGVRANVASTGKMNGFSFEYAGIPFKASDLGKSYGWKSLQERGVEYDQARDGAALIARANRSGRAGGSVDDRGSGSVDSDVEAIGGVGGKSISVAGGLPRGGELAGRHPNSDGAGDGGAPNRGAGRGAGGRDSREHSSDVSPAGGADVGHSGGEVQPVADNLGQRTEGGDQGIKTNIGSQPPVINAGGARPVRRSGFGGRVDTGGDTDGLSPQSAAHRSKLTAWTQQAAALQSPHYRLTLTSRVEGQSTFNVGKGRAADGGEEFYTAEDVAQRIPYLSAKNAAGFDVYLTPIDPNHHYLVIDDMTPTSLSSLRREGYEPALVQQSSADNLQAILRVPKLPSKFEQRAANQLVVTLNQQYGDPKFSGVIHPFRMAGFSNKKPGRGNAFTVVLEAAGVICKKAAGLLAEIRQKFTDLVPEVVVRSAGAVAPALAQAGAGAFSRARNVILGLARAQGWPLDDSRIDFRAARLLSREGFEPSEIAAAIICDSPDLAQRHHDPHDYAVRTAENASLEERAKRATKPDPSPT